MVYRGLCGRWILCAGWILNSAKSGFQSDALFGVHACGGWDGVGEFGTLMETVVWEKQCDSSVVDAS